MYIYICIYIHTRNCQEHAVNEMFDEPNGHAVRAQRPCMLCEPNGHAAVCPNGHVCCAPTAMVALRLQFKSRPTAMLPCWAHPQSPKHNSGHDLYVYIYISTIRILGHAQAKWTLSAYNKQLQAKWTHSACNKRLQEGPDKAKVRTTAATSGCKKALTKPSIPPLHKVDRDGDQASRPSRPEGEGLVPQDQLVSKPVPHIIARDYVDAAGRREPADSIHSQQSAQHRKRHSLCDNCWHDAHPSTCCSGAGHGSGPKSGEGAQDNARH